MHCWDFVKRERALELKIWPIWGVFLVGFMHTKLLEKVYFLPGEIPSCF